MAKLLFHVKRRPAGRRRKGDRPPGRQLTVASITGRATAAALYCRYTPFLIANRHPFTSDRQITLVSSAGIPLRQGLLHIDIVHLYKARGIENRHSAPC